MLWSILQTTPGDTALRYAEKQVKSLNKSYGFRFSAHITDTTEETPLNSVTLDKAVTYPAAN